MTEQVVSFVTKVISAGTRVQLPTALVRKLEIRADFDNVGIVVIGDSNVIAASGTRQGLPLNPGDLFEDEGLVIQLNTYYVDALNNNDKIVGIYIPID